MRRALGLVVGTHALLGEAVAFNSLALVVIDEQHKFGVEHRSVLRSKTSASGTVPHTLVMTATPIPRTLAMTAFSQNFWQAALWMFIGGAGSSAFQLLNNSLIMQETDQAYYGRVMSLTMMAWGLNGLVGFPIGLLADGIGERQTIFMLGMLVLAVVGVATLLHLALGRGRTPDAPVAVPTLARGD